MAAQDRSCVAPGRMTPERTAHAPLRGGRGTKSYHRRAESGWGKGWYRFAANGLLQPDEGDQTFRDRMDSIRSRSALGPQVDGPGRVFPGGRRPERIKLVFEALEPGLGFQVIDRANRAA